MAEPTVSATPASRPLAPVHREVIDLFVQFSRAVGQPKSIAEIYGLLFVSPQPLTLDDLVERLQLSKGSASQGLKYLRELGAVRVVAVPGLRRAHYEAVAELRNMIFKILDRQVSAYLSDTAARLDNISLQAQAFHGVERKHLLDRVKLLQSWERNGRQVLPFLVKILGAK